MPPEGPAHPEIAVKRRLARLLSTLTLVALASPANSLPRQSAEDFLRDLYRAEAERIAHSQTLDEAAFLSLFSPQAAELLRAALAHPDPALREGPSPNALFGWNVIPGTKVMLLGVARVLGTRDAHGLYSQFGFTPLGDPSRFQEMHRPNLYLTNPRTAS